MIGQASAVDERLRFAQDFRRDGRQDLQAQARLGDQRAHRGRDDISPLPLAVGNGDCRAVLEGAGIDHQLEFLNWCAQLLRGSGAGVRAGDRLRTPDRGKNLVREDLLEQVHRGRLPSRLTETHTPIIAEDTRPSHVPSWGRSCRTTHDCCGGESRLFSRTGGARHDSGKLRGVQSTQAFRTAKRRRIAMRCKVRHADTVRGLPVIRGNFPSWCRFCHVVTLTVQSYRVRTFGAPSDAGCTPRFFPRTRNLP